MWEASKKHVETLSSQVGKDLNPRPLVTITLILCRVINFFQKFKMFRIWTYIAYPIRLWTHKLEDTNGRSIFTREKERRTDLPSICKFSKEISEGLYV